MPRTDASAVAATISTSLTELQINAFITDANLWVTEELTSYGMSAERLETIERYLACALIRVRDLGLKSAKMDDIAEQYQVDPDVNDYMLRAAAFDVSGKIRQHFLAPKDRQQIVYRVGTGYTDEVQAGED